MLMYALIGSLIDIPFGAGKQKMTTKPSYHIDILRQSPNETTLPDAELDNRSGTGSTVLNGQDKPT